MSPLSQVVPPTLDPCSLPVARNLCPGNIAKNIASGVFDQIAKGIGSLAADLLGELGKVITAVGVVNVDLPGYRALYGRMELVALVLAVIAFIVAVAKAAAAPDAAGGLALRAVARAMLACASMPVALFGVSLLLRLADVFSAYIGGSFGGDVGTFITNLSKVLVPTAATPQGLGVLLTGGLIAFLGALALWLELALRSGAIYLLALFVPPFAAVAIYRGAGQWCRRLLVLLVGVIAAKPIIVTGATLAALLVTSTGLSDVGSGAVVGGGLLLLVAFAPVKLLGLVGHEVGLTRRDVTSMAPSPQQVAGAAAMVSSGGSAAPAVPAVAAVGAFGASPSGGGGGVADRPALRLISTPRAEEA